MLTWIVLLSPRADYGNDSGYGNDNGQTFRGLLPGGAHGCSKAE